MTTSGSALRPALVPARRRPERRESLAVGSAGSLRHWRSCRSGSRNCWLARSSTATWPAARRV